MKPASRRIARLRDTDDCTEPTTSCTSPTVNSSWETAARTRKRNGSPSALMVRTISMTASRIDIAIYRLLDIHARDWGVRQLILRSAAWWEDDCLGSENKRAE